MARYQHLTEPTFAVGLGDFLKSGPGVENHSLLNLHRLAVNRYEDEGNTGAQRESSIRFMLAKDFRRIHRV